MNDEARYCSLCGGLSVSQRSQPEQTSTVPQALGPTAGKESAETTLSTMRPTILPSAPMQLVPNRRRTLGASIVQEVFDSPPTICRTAQTSVGQTSPLNCTLKRCEAAYFAEWHHRRLLRRDKTVAHEIRRVGLAAQLLHRHPSFRLFRALESECCRSSSLPP